MWQTQPNPRRRFVPSTLSSRTHIPTLRWDSIRHTERDKVSFLLQQRDQMSAEESRHDLCDPRHTQSALQTIDRATDWPKPVPAHRRSIQEYIQIQIEPPLPRSDGNDWIAMRRQ